MLKTQENIYWKLFTLSIRIIFLAIILVIKYVLAPLTNNPFMSHRSIQPIRHIEHQIHPLLHILDTKPGWCRGSRRNIELLVDTSFIMYVQYVTM